ncbi:MAG: hypothetical protein UY48_C0002G0032 [Candidatus Gottesmanbacteria bacterium GW2011_GWB1_49_7]|uniref:Uncharacterized protein n=1 Tax=Candidatus Gottesmanbacteria bacterium GW2011_GWB1_49_7 TaxID=1618448 RepID=A0A0G1W3J9_9BACT|nr:MAG: hypothetical protein UY48_C0002G0032 [Candidatus Gottesmanbacteria bacterium GW2011_GWB1_49_7]
MRKIPLNEARNFQLGYIETIPTLREALEKAGLGAWGQEQAARNLGEAELDRATAQLEAVWARSLPSTPAGLLTEERGLYQAEFHAHLQHHIRAYRAGLRPRGSAEWWLKKEIRDSYERLFVTGREAAGKFGELTETEVKLLRKLRYQDFKYLRKFLDDLDAGRGVMDYARRMALYAAAGEQAYWAGYLCGLPQGAAVQWVLGEAEHCESCPELATGGPWKNGIYEPTDLLSRGLFPKSLKLACKRGCQCSLKAVRRPAGRRPPWKAGVGSTTVG